MKIHINLSMDFWGKLSKMKTKVYLGLDTSCYSTSIAAVDINKNIILIGGENGAGKTTMLESIKLAIYGCFFYGVKNPNNKYYENIYFKFNNKAKAEKKWKEWKNKEENLLRKLGMNEDKIDELRGKKDNFEEAD